MDAASNWKYLFECNQMLWLYKILRQSITFNLVYLKENLISNLSDVWKIQLMNSASNFFHTDSPQTCFDLLLCSCYCKMKTEGDHQSVQIKFCKYYIAYVIRTYALIIVTVQANMSHSK